MCVRILADTIFAAALAANCRTGDSRAILVRVCVFAAAALDKSRALVGKLEILTVSNFPILMRSPSRSVAAARARAPRAHAVFI